MADRTSTSRTNGSDLLLNESTITTIVRRIYNSVQSISEEKPPSDTRSTNASIEQEVSQRFSLPRCSRGSSENRGRGSLNSNSRPKYNPNTNYGHGSTSRGKDEKSLKNSKGKTGRAQEHVHKKELILLPHPTYDHVPRFDHKRKLQELGLIIDGFPVG